MASEVNSYTVSSQIPLGRCPVYAVESSDAKRLFVLNRGSDTITVINTQDDTLDSCTPFANQAGQTVTCHHPPCAFAYSRQYHQRCVHGIRFNASAMRWPAKRHQRHGVNRGPGLCRIHAATSQLVIANYDGGTISIIDVSLDEWGNDSSTFGTTFTVPVGKNPASVTVLYDGSRAYTANQTDQTVSVVNLSSHTVVNTLPVTGHPRNVASTQNSSYGKVYVASPDSNVLTILAPTRTSLTQRNWSRAISWMCA